VTFGEIEAAPKPTDRQVWAVCPYISKEKRCKGCPASEEHPEKGSFVRMCRALAEEACRVVVATAGPTGGT
jgi:hypothetical protein